MIEVGTTIHASWDVEGLLLGKRSLRGLLVRDGHTLTDGEVRRELLTYFGRGIRRLPAGARCEGFSDVSGCPGHCATKEAT